MFGLLRRTLVCVLLARTSSGSARIYVCSSYTLHVSVHLYLLSNLILLFISQINRFHSTL